MREIGLSLPLFIKWDDSEYGVRAQAAGYPTVTMPGVAVWHVPWTDKNDALDWQAYFHQRNRFVAALLHSPFPHGGRMIRESFNHQVKHLLAMQYSTVELRHLALEDVLAGPDQLHDDLPTKLGEVRELRKRFTDAQLEAGPQRVPARRAAPSRARRTWTPRSRAAPRSYLSAVKGSVRQFLGTRPLSREFPESAVPAMDARWFRLATLDSAVVSMPDGTSAALYQRDPELFRDLLRRTIEIHERLYREWPRLSQLYRDQLGEVTSPAALGEDLRGVDGGDADGHRQQARAAGQRRRARAPGQRRPPRPPDGARTRPTRCRSSRPAGPRKARVVEAELVAPAPRGGIIETIQQPYLLRLIVSRQLAQMYAASLLGLPGPTSSRRCASASTTS